MSTSADKIECGVNSLPDPSGGTESKIKYVEAPIPKVNPWKKNEISSDKLKETNKDQICNISDIAELHDKKIHDDSNNLDNLRNSAAIQVKEDKTLQETTTINANISPNLSCENSLLESKLTVTNLEDTDIATTDSQSVSSVFQAIGGGNAWKGSADTMSKLGPSQDAKVDEFVTFYFRSRHKMHIHMTKLINISYFLLAFNYAGYR